MEPLILKSILNSQGFPEGFLTALRQAASELKVKRIALVGGSVRDGLLINRSQQILPNRNKNDIDLVIEGSAKELVGILTKCLGEDTITCSRSYEAYDTVKLKFNGVEIDFATSREESYCLPGENPSIKASVLEKDLARRDFKVNAMAIELLSQEFLDPFGGINDLKAGKLNFLHSKSVEEDPTRVIRAARYSARLGFELTPEGIKQVKSTISNWPWEDLSTNKCITNQHLPALSTRLRMEFELLFEKEPWKIAIKNLQDWGALSLLDNHLQKDKEWSRRLHWGLQLGLPLLTVLIAGTNKPLKVAKRLQLSQKQQKLLQESHELKEILIERSLENYHENSLVPSYWCKFLESSGWQPESVALAISMNAPMRHYLLRWLLRWRKQISPKSAKTLLMEGWEEGPRLGEELNRLRLNEIDKCELKKQ
ncbi:CCA tRNA nucleotidyltransferase [Prochlorococcus sp. MIT 1300]|uniref:CCA tRNA nucleotidyltransferase n=1 Tax=Prochlorococcus sp. MIT 1300 TaxID=3096218 RepID=UPI002A752BD4|nr:CCA tRNA nucleotidyltransferase [Prochlorococcus sp. MIT 1300]